ncbi:hypothetical protein G6M26_30800 [Agrobacterium tumefaciens]|nr:hypothetical protein [Agrobacterium tumefaciens]NTE22941.1 hypothetical protein [Agrobacterium tumefaciens]
MADFQKKLRNILYNSKLSKYKVLAAIKRELNPGEFEAAINSNPLLKRAKLSGSILDNEYSVHQREAYHFTDDIRVELPWIAYDLKQYGNLLNEFISKKNEFEKLIFLARYDEAAILLNDIKEFCGISLWHTEMSLMLKEYQKGTKANWELLSYYLTQFKNPFYQFVISFYSKRIEENMSYENCFNQFQTDFDEVNADTMVRDFFVFKCLYNASFDYDHKDFSGVTFINQIFGVVDQYLLIIEIMMRLVAQGDQYDRTVLKSVNRLLPIVQNDYRLANLSNLLDHQSSAIKLINSTNLIFIIDCFAVGDYDRCINECLENLKQCPTAFELYELYCKSLINSKSKFVPTDISPIVDKILDDLYSALLYESGSENARGHLLKHSLKYFSFDFGKQLSAFAISLENVNYSNTEFLISCLSSSFNNPKILSLNFPSRRNVLMQKSSQLYSEISSSVNNYLGGYSDVKVKSNDPIQQCIYKARHLFSKNLYRETLEVLSHYDNDCFTGYYRDIKTSLTYISLIKTGKPDEAMVLYSTLLSADRYLVEKLDCVRLIGIIKENGYDNYANYIDLPILASVEYKAYFLYEPYIEFMISCDEEYPSRLNHHKLIQENSFRKVLYFLREVCNVSVLKYSLEFDSIEKAEQERLDICKVLQQLDPDNKYLYQQEIAEILKRGAVRRAIKEVNEGRLYVNVESLKGQQLNQVRESFARFKELEQTTRSKELKGFNSSKDRNWISVDIKTTELDTKYDDPAFLAFKSIYFTSKERFLFSKEYGLDSCLSTNFRHGSVKNHIRSVFEKLHLVTPKLEEKYVQNLYWKDKLEIDVASIASVQQLLSEFSKEIDDYTKYIINNLIQIRTERHPEKKDALFSYFTDDESIWNFYVDNKERLSSVDSLINLCYTDLTNATLGYVFLTIYNNFTSKINDSFQSYIQKLHEGLKELGLNTQSELSHNLVKSSTDIRVELDVIASWFNLNTTNSSSLLDIETIIIASKEYINRINPTFCIEPQINVEFPILAFSNLIFVFNILLNNIIEHSNLKSEEVEVSINVYEPINGTVEVKVKNTISSSVDKDHTICELQKVKDDWNNHENIDRSNTEGGSGFVKIKRLLIYEVEAKTDKFSFSVSDNDVSISLFLPFKSAPATLEAIIKAAIGNNYKIDDRFQINIDKECELIRYNNVITFALSNLINVLVILSNNPTEEISIITDISQKRTDLIEFKFTVNMNTDHDSENLLDSLVSIKQSWSTISDDLDSKIERHLRKLKRRLNDEAEISFSEFDYFYSNDQLSLSLLLPTPKL